MTYGALVVQLIQDYEDYAEVNKQLDQMYVRQLSSAGTCTTNLTQLVTPLSHYRGYNIGTRLIEDFLARSNMGRCADFREVGEVVAKVRRPVTSDINPPPFL